MTAFTKVKVYRLAALACAAWLGLTASSGIAQVAGGSAISPTGAAATAGVNRIDLANQILNRWQPIAEASGQDIVIWREIFSTQFGLMSDAVLRRLAAVSADAGTAKANYTRFTDGVRSAIMQSYQLGLTGKGHAKDLGLAGVDLVFLPIPPCRIVDTRAIGGPPNAGGPIVHGTSRQFFYYNEDAAWSWSTGELGNGGQGGVAGPANSACPRTTLTSAGGTLGSVAPRAAMATVTVVNTTAAGNFNIWGGAGSPPTTSALNWTGAGTVLANTTVIPWGGRGAVEDFAVFYNGPSGQADVVVDLVGYFLEDGATALDCTTIATDFTIPASNNAFTATSGSCPTGRTLTGGGMDTQFTSASMMYYDSAPEGGDHWRCRGRNVDFTATFTGTCYAICCRLPGQ